MDSASRVAGLACVGEGHIRAMALWWVGRNIRGVACTAFLLGFDFNGPCWVHVRRGGESTPLVRPETFALHFVLLSICSLAIRVLSFWFFFFAQWQTMAMALTLCQKSHSFPVFRLGSVRTSSNASCHSKTDFDFSWSVFGCLGLVSERWKFMALSPVHPLTPDESHCATTTSTQLQLQKFQIKIETFF